MSNFAVKQPRNTGPRIGRRRTVSLSAVAGGSSAVETADPVLAALAKWREMKARVDAQRVVNDRAEAAYLSEVRDLPHGVTFKGLTMRTLEHLDHEFSSGLLSLHGPECEAATRLRGELRELDRLREEASRRHGYFAEEGMLRAALGEMWEFEKSVLRLSPTTAAGALEMLAFLSYWLEDNRDFCLMEFEPDGVVQPAPARVIRDALEVLAGDVEARG